MNTMFTVIAMFFLFIIIKRRFSVISSDKVKNISAEEAKKIISETKELIILDVRTKGEYSSGHIPKAKSIPVEQISERVKELDKYKEKPVLVYCASGGRSPIAVKTLLSSGFTSIYHMNKGISSWNYSLNR